MKIYETLFRSRSITRKIDTIVVHCAAVSITSHVTTEDIARWHIQERHFRDIGYHFIVDKLGIIHLGRPLNEMGAHCKGHNAHSIGICYIGGLDAQGNPADTRTPLQQLAIKQLIGLLVNEFKIYDVYGHRDLSPDVNGDGQITSVDWVKMCPCYDAHAEWLQYLKEMAIVARNYGQARMGNFSPKNDDNRNGMTLDRFSLKSGNNRDGMTLDRSSPKSGDNRDGMTLDRSSPKSGNNRDGMTLDRSSPKSGEVGRRLGEVDSNPNSNQNQNLSKEDHALLNLCQAAEEYLGVTSTESTSETSSSYLDDAENYAGESPYDEDSFESLTILEDPPPDELLRGCEVPPSHQSCAPAPDKAPEARLYLGAWKGMNWRGWGMSRGRMRRN